MHSHRLPQMCHGPSCHRAAAVHLSKMWHPARLGVQLRDIAHQWEDHEDSGLAYWWWYGIWRRASAIVDDDAAREHDEPAVSDDDGKPARRHGRRHSQSTVRCYERKWSPDDGLIQSNGRRRDGAHDPLRQSLLLQASRQRDWVLLQVLSHHRLLKVHVLRPQWAWVSPTRRCHKHHQAEHLRFEQADAQYQADQWWQSAIHWAYQARNPAPERAASPQHRQGLQRADPQIVREEGWAQAGVCWEVYRRGEQGLGQEPNIGPEHGWDRQYWGDLRRTVQIYRKEFGCEDTDTDQRHIVIHQSIHWSSWAHCQVQGLWQERCGNWPGTQTSQSKCAKSIWPDQ